MLKVGLQTHGVKDCMNVDPVSTLKSLGEKGYRHLEFANVNALADNGIGYGISAELLKETLNAYDLNPISIHLTPGFKDVEADGIITRVINRDDYELIDYKKIAQYQEIIGNSNVCCASYRFNGYEHLMASCEMFNRIGRVCKENGLCFIYHNHTELGEIMGDKTAVDLMAENTDPELVQFELDTHWLMASGLDPVAVIKKLGKRVRLIHQRDYPKGIGDSTHEKMLDVLQDIIDATIEYTSCEYFILEQVREAFEQIRTDKENQLDTIQLSLENYKGFKNLSFED